MQIKFLYGTAALCLAATAASVADAQTTPPPVLPSVIGTNLTTLSYYSQERAFANLAAGTIWTLTGGVVPPAADVTPDGGVAALPAGGTATFYLTPPDAPNGVPVKCTWLGTANFRLQSNGAATNIVNGTHSVTFTWTNNWAAPAYVWLNFGSVLTTDPIHSLDCRETTMPADALFDPAFVQSLSGFKTLRFMDWMQTNNNPSVTWANRNPANAIDVGSRDGVPVEDMMALANQVGADPWFNMSYFSSLDYVKQFALYVHANLPANGHVYVELGNEMWNSADAAAKDAQNAGLAEGLSTNRQLAGLYRYALSYSQYMQIWAGVFADRPGSLIRVISTQHVNPATASAVLGYQNTAANVDALATAPYFGSDIMNEGVTSDPNVVFSRFPSRISTTISQALQNQAVAATYGKAYISYEAGQAMVIPYDVPLMLSVERDPRMAGIYTQFINAWSTQVGGGLNLFANVGGIGGGGAWGMYEYSGQALANAPKMQAVTQAMGQ